MINRIKLTNFKCFELVDLKLSPITLFCGVNGAGKSSVIQALLLLRQSLKSGELRENKLNLNGNLVELGVGLDLLFERAISNKVGIELEDEGRQILFRANLTCSKDSSESDQLSFADYSTMWGSYSRWEDSPPFGGEFKYVAAERIGPRKIYSHSEAAAVRGEFGAQSEHAMSYLYTRQNDRLSPDDPRCADLERNTMLSIVRQWLKEILPNTYLDIQIIPEVDSLRVGFVFEQPGDVRSRSYRTTNVGFGLSYVLPVLVSYLTPPGSLCIIENPEAHLHPRGQSKLAHFAVLAALAGVQVLVETHSDHFMNGVRIAVRNNLISPDQVSIHNFERRESKSIVSTPKIDSDGRLSEWPTEFFDQYEMSLAELLAPKS